MAGNGDLTIDEIMALGDKHTQAMKPKVKKKTKSKKNMGKVNQKQPGLAESREARLMSGLNSAINHRNSMNKRFNTGE